jgi:hypothetical protein
MNRYLMIVASLGLACGVADRGQAGAIVFGFEDQTATALPFGGAITSLSMTQSGLTVTITRPGDTFDILNTGVIGLPASYGTRTLSSFNSELAATPYIADFSLAASAVSLDFGDFGSDIDRLVLEAYSGLGASGALLASAPGLLPGGGSTFTSATLSVAVEGIRSIRFIGGSTNFPHSVYNDNLKITVAQATVVPEPSTLVAGALFALIGLGYSARRRPVA